MITHTEVRDLIGAELLDSSGIKVGRIGQIYLDESTGELEWATVDTGHLGVNETFVPLAQADRAGHAVRVPYEKATIKDAPSMFACGAYLDEPKERELYVYYGLDYAGQRSDSGIPSGQATSIQPGRGTEAKRGPAGHDTSGRNTDDAMIRSRRSTPGPENVTAGKARLRKWVETEDVYLKVPVAKESVAASRTPHGSP
jgi:sporulation protein YlmC with PRC-barrel domain